MAQAPTVSNNVTITTAGSVGFVPTPSVETVVSKIGIWKPPVSVSIELTDRSKLPGLYYETLDAKLPGLAVLTTTSSVCGDKVASCLSPNGKFVILGQQEIDSTDVVINKLLFPKKGILSKSERERIQLGTVTFQLKLVETGGDLYKASESLLNTVYAKPPEPKQVLEFIFRSRPLEDYLFAVRCYGELNKENSVEFSHGGRYFKELVKRSFAEAKNKMPLPEDLQKQGISPQQAIGQLVKIRNDLLNPETSVAAITGAEKKFAEFLQNKQK